MKIIRDYENRKIRLTDERYSHIQEHPEMKNMDNAIEETIRNPKLVIQSISDKSAQLYYNYYHETYFGDKWLCVVIKYKGEDAFILTAYLTDTIKQGVQIWPKK